MLLIQRDKNIIIINTGFYVYVYFILTNDYNYIQYNIGMYLTALNLFSIQLNLRLTDSNFDV